MDITPSSALYRKLVEASLKRIPSSGSRMALHDSGNPKELLPVRASFRKELKRKSSRFAYDELVRIYREGENWESDFGLRAAAALTEDVACLRPSAMHTSRRIAPPSLKVFETLIALEPDARRLCRSAPPLRGDPARLKPHIAGAEIAPQMLPLFQRLADVFSARPFGKAQAASTLPGVSPDEPLY